MKTELITEDMDPVAGGGVHLRITAEPNDAWEGSTHASHVGENGGIPVLFCRWDVKEKATGEKKRICFRLDTRAELRATLKEWQAAQAAWEAAREQMKQDKKEAIRAGETPIILRYHDGEYLSGYMVFGPAIGLLKDIGLAREVSGWGTLVDDEAAKALGTSFTFPQAIAFAENDPKRKAEAEKKTQRLTEREKILSGVKVVEVGSCRTAPGSDGDDLECSVTITAIDGQVYRATFRNLCDVGLLTPNWPKEVLAAAMEMLPDDMRRIRM